MVELTFVVNRSFSLAQVASTILHEGMHARLHAMGRALDDSPAQERFCREAEIAFGERVPGGEPVVERARAALELADAEIAPVIDPALAARRVADADRNSQRNSFSRPPGHPARALSRPLRSRRSRPHAGARSIRRPRWMASGRRRCTSPAV